MSYSLEPYNHYPGPGAIFVFKMPFPTIAGKEFLFSERKISVYD